METYKKKSKFSSKFITDNSSNFSSGFGGAGRGQENITDAWLWEDGTELLWEDNYYIKLES